MTIRTIEKKQAVKIGLELFPKYPLCYIPHDYFGKELKVIKILDEGLSCCLAGESESLSFVIPFAFIESLQSLDMYGVKFQDNPFI